MSIPFTQFHRPNGRPEAVSIDRPADVEAKAREVIARGWKFECEVLTTGHVHLDVCNADEQLASEICDNGPAVEGAVDRLVAAAHARLDAPKERSE